MQIDIIGTGAIGLLFAARLRAAGYAVKLWASSLEKAKLLQNQGITYCSTTGETLKLQDIPCASLAQFSANRNETTISSDSEATSNEAGAHTNEAACILLAVKQSHLDDNFIAALRVLIAKGNYGAVFALQNGYGHIERLGQAISIPVLTAVTSEASKRLDDVTIEHTGHGVTWIGDELGRDFACFHQKNMEFALQMAGFNASMSKNIKEQVFRKLISNAIINPLTALFDIPNGELPLSIQRRKLMEALFNESKMVLMTEEPALGDCLFDDILDLCRATASNTSSMRADLLKGSSTEVAYINGAIVAIARRHQLPAYLNESIVHMIEALHPV